MTSVLSLLYGDQKPKNCGKRISMGTHDSYTSIDTQREIDEIESGANAQFKATSAKTFVTVATLGYALAWAATQLF
jgi:hypothetical protein